MAKVEKSRDMKFHVLNVKIRKAHSKDDVDSAVYINAFKKIFGLRIHSESSTKKHCIFRFMFEEKENSKILFLSGTFAQFTYIENKDWFSIKELDFNKKFKLPEGLFPDAVIVDYIFIPDVHRFCYRIKAGQSVSPYPISNFLQKSLEKVIQSGDVVHVDVETDRSAIDKILKAKSIRKIKFDLNYSNADFSKSVKKFVDDDIRASNAKKIEIIATHKKDDTIDINKSKILKGSLEVAQSNGEVVASIINEEGKIELVKTIESPLIERVHGVPARFNYLVQLIVLKKFKSRRMKK